nr:MAG TPA: hypothetical protein [Caudoviricetes sp.]
MSILTKTAVADLSFVKKTKSSQKPVYLLILKAYNRTIA